MDAPPNPNAATPPLQDVEDAIVEEFSIFDDPMDRYAYLIDLGKRLDAWPAERQTDDKLVPGCQSKVWLEAEALPDGRIRFDADSNTVITKGIIALLIRVLSGRPAAEIAAAELGFIDRIDLRAHLSGQRANGLASMVRTMKALAVHTEPPAA
jgi:cysteine desulfuration protein SufE